MRDVSPPPDRQPHNLHRRLATLQFEVGGSRTILRRQHVPYPLHITRVFYLDHKRPDIATLYLQSASGGLYRGDRVDLTLDFAAGSAAHVTTQAATVVHDTRGRPARQHCQISVGEGAYAIVALDPFVLFPKAALLSTTEIKLAEGGCAVLTEGFACHDPGGRGEWFDCFASSTLVHDVRGRLLVADRGAIVGAKASAAASPLGPYRAAGNILGLRLALPSSSEATRLERELAGVGCLAGVTALPNGAGLGLRLLAPDGGMLARGLELASGWAFEQLIGIPPARRRK